MPSYCVEEWPTKVIANLRLPSVTFFLLVSHPALPDTLHCSSMAKLHTDSLPCFLRLTILGSRYNHPSIFAT